MPGLTRRGFFRGILGAVGAVVVGKDSARAFASGGLAPPPQAPTLPGDRLCRYPFRAEPCGYAGPVPGTTSYTAHGPINEGDLVGLRPDGTVESLRRG